MEASAREPTRIHSVTTTGTPLPRASAGVGPSSLSHQGRIRRHIRQHDGGPGPALRPGAACLLGQVPRPASCDEGAEPATVTKAARAVTEARTRRACDLSTAGSCLPCYEANCRRGTTTGCSFLARKPPSPSPADSPLSGRSGRACSVGTGCQQSLRLLGGGTRKSRVTAADAPIRAHQDGGEAAGHAEDT